MHNMEWVTCMPHGWPIPHLLAIMDSGGSAWEVCGHIEPVKILVILNPTSYMLTSSGSDAFIHLRYIYSIDSCTVMGKIPEVLMNFNRLYMSRTQPVHLQLTAGSSRT